MERYKLLRDLPNAKAGEIFELTNTGLGHSYEDGSINWFCLFNDCELKKFDILNPEKGWFEKIEEKKYGGRVPKEGAMFYYITPTGAIIKHEWVDGHICESMFDCGSAFWTSEEAEKEAKRRKAYVILKEDTKGFEPDWENSYIDKYYVYYDYGKKRLGVDYSFCCKSCLMHFATRADAEASIKAHRKQWLDYLGIEVKNEQGSI